MRVAEGIEVFTLAQRPELETAVRTLPGTFPEFMHHDAVVERHWDALFTRFAGFQIAVCDDAGGVLAVKDAGAYGFSMASNYNSRPRPAEVMVRGDSWAVVREREQNADLVKGELVPAFL